MHDQPTFSPRLQALHERIMTGDYAAVGEFWTEIEAQGSPLIEPIAGDECHVLVTFLWREIATIESAVVMGGVTGFNDDDGKLTRLGGTNVWYWTTRVRSDIRTTYKLAVRGTGWEHWLLDPLNPRAYVSRRINDESEEAEDGFNDSVLDLPNAISERWVEPREDVPHGQVNLHRLMSAIIERERRVWIYLPPGYDPNGEPYSLLVITDGEMYVQFLPTVLDNLIAEGAIRPTVAAMLASPTGDIGARLHELACAPEFAATIHDELLPWLQGIVNVSADRERAVIAGSSLGGLTAASLGMSLSDVFGNVLTQSGSFWWRPGDDAEHVALARQYLESPTLPTRFFQEVGVLENVPTPGHGPSQLHANRHLRDVLRAKGYDVTYREFGGGHNYLAWRATIADGLMTLLGSGQPRGSQPAQHSLDSR